MASDDLSGIVRVPDNAGLDLRRHLGLGPDAPLRISYLPGPGDVAGTFDHWRAGRHDPRVPIASYSLMFYQLAADLGAQCQIIALHPVGASATSAMPQFRFDELQELGSSGRWTYFRSQRRLRRDLVAKVAEFDPHIVVASTHYPAAAWSELSRGRKLVLSTHNTFWVMGHPPGGPLGRARKALLTLRSRALDGATCVSDECARQVAQVTSGRIAGHVACAQVVCTYPVKGHRPLRNIAFLGRIETSKGIFLLLDAFARLADRYPQLNLVIAGTGAKDAELATAVRNSPHAERIQVRGRVGSDEVHALLTDSDLLVCPTMTTFNEGLPVVVCEAASHGVPSVISSVVPATELMGQAGLVYRADDAADLHDVIDRLVRDQDAFNRACDATARVRESIYDRSLSWGSKLYSCLIDAPSNGALHPG